jgi:hypothetical protein
VLPPAGRAMGLARLADGGRLQSGAKRVNGRQGDQVHARPVTEPIARLGNMPAPMVNANDDQLWWAGAAKPITSTAVHGSRDWPANITSGITVAPAVMGTFAAVRCPAYR